MTFAMVGLLRCNPYKPYMIPLVSMSVTNGPPGLGNKFVFCLGFSCIRAILGL